MSREEFINLLARSIADGAISEADARELLRRFDAGEIDMAGFVPIPPTQQESRVDGNLALAAFLSLLALAGRQAPAVVSLQTVTATLTLQVLQPARVSAIARTGLIDAVQSAFEADVRALAGRYARGELALVEWQTAMGERLRSHLVQQVATGAGRANLTAAELGRIEQLAQRELAYLSRFADQIAVRNVIATPLSEAQIAVRSEAYAGTGRGEAFRAAEAEAGAEDGVVYDYVSRDDNATCDRCLDADRRSPYLPGQGPMPGSVCRGRASCRCNRVPRYDLPAWERLTGRVAA
jgi:hypothetical protein